MHYAGSRNPRALTNPLRSVPTFQSWGRVRGPSALDHAEGDYRIARDACDFTLSMARACAALGRANRTRPEYRRQAQATAFREINAIRRARRAAWVRRDAVEVALYRAGGSAAAVDAADAARLAQHRAATAHLPRFGLVGIEDVEDNTVDPSHVPAFAIAAARATARA